MSPVGDKLFLGVEDASESLKEERSGCYVVLKARRPPLRRDLTAPYLLSCNTNSWSAAVNSSATGEVEATGAWPEAAAGDGSTSFTFEPLSVLLRKRPESDQGGVSKVKVSELVNQ